PLLSQVNFKSSDFQQRYRDPQMFFVCNQVLMSQHRDLQNKVLSLGSEDSSCDSHQKMPLEVELVRIETELKNLMDARRQSAPVPDSTLVACRPDILTNREMARVLQDPNAFLGNYNRMIQYSLD